METSYRIKGKNEQTNRKQKHVCNVDLNMEMPKCVRFTNKK